MPSHHLPDPELVDYADLAARHVAALSERDRQTKIAETATLQLQQARHELGRLRDRLERQRRRRPGLGTAATIVLVLAAFGGGFGLGVAQGRDGPATVGRGDMRAAPARTSVARTPRCPSPCAGASRASAAARCSGEAGCRRNTDAVMAGTF